MAAKAPQGMRGPVLTVEDDYTMTAGDFCIRVNANSKTITLPAVSGGPQLALVVAATSSITGVAVVPAGSDTISFQPDPSGAGLYISDGITNWFS